MTMMTTFKAGLPRLPPRDTSVGATRNPFRILGDLTFLQWAFWLAGVLAWSADAIDFFAVSLAAGRLATSFNTPLSQISTSITLTLLFRTVGAIIGGISSDRFGRRYPLVINLLICAALSLATAFCTDFKSFLAVRALFGISMGGVWSQAVSGAFENLPVQARGMASGVLQQGYAIGYLTIACANLALGPSIVQWQRLFYVAAGISVFAALVRLALPESQFFLDQKAREAASGIVVANKNMTFIREAGRALKLHWKRCIFAVVFMAAFNFLSHGSQDLYPSMMSKGKGFSASDATLLTIIGNCGSIFGGTIAGYVSQYLGRRLTMIAFVTWTGLMLPLWDLPTTFLPLAIGVFLFQAGVQGAWGIIPIYLTEISPVAFRATWPGVSYQLGNMISAASAQIEATAGEKITNAAGLPDYGTVSAILLGTVIGAIIIMCLFGAEAHSSHFENSKAAFESGAGDDDLVEGDDEKSSTTSVDMEKSEDNKV